MSKGRIMNVVVFAYGLFGLVACIDQFNGALIASRAGMIPVIGPLNVSSYIIVGLGLLGAILIIAGVYMKFKNEKNLKFIILGLVGVLLLHILTVKPGDAVLDGVLIGLVYYSTV